MHLRIRRGVLIWPIRTNYSPTTLRSRCSATPVRSVGRLGDALPALMPKEIFDRTFGIVERAGTLSGSRMSISRLHWFSRNAGDEINRCIPSVFF